MDIAHLVAVKGFENNLSDITKDQDIGTIYKDNIFVNEYLNQT